MSAVRFALNSHIDNIVNHLINLDIKLTFDDDVRAHLSDFRPSTNLSENDVPLKEVPVVYLKGEHAQVRLMRNKLILPGNETEENARAFVKGEDIIDETARWKAPKKDFRCIVPCEGFYSLPTSQASKVNPHYIRHKDGGLLFMAGLYSQTPRDGVDVYGFALVSVPPPKVKQDRAAATSTSASSARMRAKEDWENLSKRHPLLLTREEIIVWLGLDDPYPFCSEQVKDIVRRPHDDDEIPMVHFQVLKGVYTVGKENPDFMKPISERKGGIDSFLSPKSPSTQPSSSPPSPSTSRALTQATLGSFPMRPKRKREAKPLKVTVNMPASPSTNNTSSSHTVAGTAQRNATAGPSSTQTRTLDLPSTTPRQRVDEESSDDDDDGAEPGSNASHAIDLRSRSQTLASQVRLSSEPLEYTDGEDTVSGTHSPFTFSRSPSAIRLTFDPYTAGQALPMEDVQATQTEELRPTDPVVGGSREPLENLESTEGGPVRKRRRVDKGKGRDYHS